ncbi:hypothetical protein OAF54_01185 [bacterium]|nr:hypothetical protein [bacterium]
METAQQICDILNQPGDKWDCKPEGIQPILDRIKKNLTNAENGEVPPNEFDVSTNDVAGPGALGLSRWGDMWFANTGANAATAAREDFDAGGDIAKICDKRLKGVPCVLVGGAEDLYENLDTLWAIRDKAVIISVDAAWRIVPADIVFNVDCQPKIEHHYSSAWLRGRDRILVSSIFATPKVPYTWAKVGGAVRWYIPKYLPELMPDHAEDYEAACDLFSGAYELDMYANSLGSALSMICDAWMGPVITVGATFGWRARKAWDRPPTYETPGEDTRLIHNSIGRHPDGPMRTTKELDDFANIIMREFDQQVYASIVRRQVGDEIESRIEWRKTQGVDLYVSGYGPSVLTPDKDRVPFEELADELLKEDIDKSVLEDI